MIGLKCGNHKDGSWKWVILLCMINKQLYDTLYRAWKFDDTTIVS